MARSPGYLAAESEDPDVSELRLIAGMDAALYLRLLPFVCALPDDALQLNVNTLRVDQAFADEILPTGVNLQQARQLLQDRPRAGVSALPLSGPASFTAKRYRRRPPVADGSQSTVCGRSSP